MAIQDPIRTESFGELMRGILSDLRTLIRDEIALARVEFQEEAGRARAAALSFGVMAVAFAFGATFLLGAVAIACRDLLGWPLWTGFLAVALLMSAVGALAMASGRKQLRQMHAVPEQTVSSLKENAAWIAKRLSSMPR